jgi:hypothetical protein
MPKASSFLSASPIGSDVYLGLRGYTGPNTGADMLFTAPPSQTFPVLAGADATGATDSTAAFSAAAQGAASGVNSQGGIGGPGITFAPNATIYVPPGTYTISSEVNTGGVDVTWILADGALIANYQFLNGRVMRDGRRVNKITYGIGDFAAGYSVRVNAPLEGGAEVMGFTAASQIGSYPTRDSVGFYVDNTAPAPIATIANSGTTYTSTAILFSIALTAAQLAQMRSGMIFNTAHATTYWSGFITAWAANQITVSGWYKSDGSGASTPTNGTGGYANPTTKIWAHNANVTIGAGTITAAAAGFELGILNNSNNPGGPGGAPLMWGYDCVNLGTYPCEVAHIARGGSAGFYYGFESNDNGTAFYSFNDSVGLNVASCTGPTGIETTGTWAAGILGFSLGATMNGGATVTAINNGTTYGAAVTTGLGVASAPTAGAGAALTSMINFQAGNVALGSGASVATQYGFLATALSTATNNVGFQSQVNAAAGSYGFRATGTATNLFNGMVNITAAAAAVSSGLGISGAQQTTVGATGAASALPANPLGYIVGYVGATKIAVPYYNG